ncbi:hypothetical protein Prede_1975 [Prevotella dentalis DSM 3688]|uniref:Uncharacterized protein n=1 Tax=Prevotella dentalis (strain ATCC 49559 / DSM 3688 / JCM 13448 / NCTC 12043 / ES 2772) TaxID=908937 RepID=F9D5M5_PREDD|nr:hypothetical protein [Prevotella dentalis]AGB29255.1 hypothetical protein Prede_1975 [Prevotella dentalis DSM 3688]EGQ13177.1 hypothetical protein HMPREF9136_2153 [Prevotella dentalis DSM 3688]
MKKQYIAPTVQTRAMSAESCLLQASASIPVSHTPTTAPLSKDGGACMEPKPSLWDDDNDEE